MRSALISFLNVLRFFIFDCPKVEVSQGRVRVRTFVQNPTATPTATLKGKEGRRRHGGRKKKEEPVDEFCAQLTDYSTLIPATFVRSNLSVIRPSFFFIFFIYFSFWEKRINTFHPFPFLSFHELLFHRINRVTVQYIRRSIHLWMKQTRQPILYLTSAQLRRLIHLKKAVNNILFTNVGGKNMARSFFADPPGAMRELYM